MSCELDEWERRESVKGHMPLCLGAPVTIRRDLDVAESVTFLSVGLGAACERTTWRRREGIP